MCGRYSQLTDVEITAKKYDAVLEPGHIIHTDLNWDKLDTGQLLETAKATKTAPLILPNYNISHSNASIIIYEDLPNKSRMMVKGFFKFSKQFTDYKTGKTKTFSPLNARCEGKIKGKTANPTDDPDYGGPYHIFDSPFWKHVNTHRCAIPANYFIEGPKEEKLSIPYIIRRGDGETFLLGGLWKYYVNKETAEEIREFAIITTPANELCDKIGHHRSPVIIPDNSIDEWLHPESSRELVSTFFKPFDPSQFFAYQISPDVKRPNTYGFGNNSEYFIRGVDQPIFPSNYEGPENIKGDTQIFKKDTLF